MLKIPCLRKDIEVYLISAGHYFTDAGAAMGVLPHKLWYNKIELDDDYCMKMQLNCLLIKSEKFNILIDCGIGDNYSENQKKIFKPGKFILLSELNSVGIDKKDITHIVLTHLHFDHAGGILTSSNEFLFKNSKVIIQKDEWDTALEPDKLNAAAYPLAEHYQFLSSFSNLFIVDGEYEIARNVFVVKTGGHSPGMQIVKILDNESIIYFAGDVFPSGLHLNPTITSAYEISRKDLFIVKENILKDLKKYKGTLILSHEIENPIIHF